MTAVMYNSQYKMIKLLLERDANPNITTKVRT